MIKIENYWIDDRPTLEDIKEAYDLVSKNNIIIKISWYVEYSGSYSRMVTKEHIAEMSAEEYFEKVIPHVYGV